MLFVTDFTDGRTAIYVDFTNFARAQTDLSVCTFFSQQYRRSTGRTCDLSTFTGFHFDTVDSRTNGNVADRQGVAYFDGSFSTGNQYDTGLNTARSDDVTTLAVCIAQQCDEGSTVRIVFDTLYFSRNAVFVTFKVYNTVMVFMTAAFVTGGDMTIIVTAGSRIFFSSKGA
ncbi:Uncharacterised protein [Neisseria gonorrhoeae]|uniref:Uncharacterized protein n=1 Tax=Neisseria gonorrhoeae TaxID=485 RepID=A0A379B136_NEIGO|nr:Uncharacterised protein [Neisseria gonorrhoeae]